MYFSQNEAIIAWVWLPNHHSVSIILPCFVLTNAEDAAEYFSHLSNKWYQFILKSAPEQLIFLIILLLSAIESLLQSILHYWAVNVSPLDKQMCFVIVCILVRIIIHNLNTLSRQDLNKLVTDSQYWNTQVRSCPGLDWVSCDTHDLNEVNIKMYFLNV